MKMIEYGIRRLYFTVTSNPHRIYIDALSEIADANDINICRNDRAREDYQESKINVLIATESPAVVEAEDWLDPGMDFHAEFSFGDFYNLEQYYSLRRMHAGRDYWVSLDKSNSYDDKSNLVSTVISEKTQLSGQAMRHRVAEEYGDQVDTYGAGVDNYVEDKSDTLDDYMFQVVIENGKYPEYISEKFFDCIKTNTIPIYWGGEVGVKKMGFDTDGVIFFENIGGLSNILSNISEDTYDNLRPSAMDNRSRLIQIRNEIKKQFYLDNIRLGFLRDKKDNLSKGKYHLKFE